jgi:hypothetical protein
MPARSKNGYDTFLKDFTRVIYVICPACHKQAVVEAPPIASRLARLTCPYCGLSKEKQATPYSLGRAADPFFDLPLWLTARSRNNQLWAYNDEHLQFLRDHVEAQLRERNGLAMRNQSLGSRLPKWMLTKKNRSSLLKSIKHLEEIEQNC